jgi:hypothetical protein
VIEQRLRHLLADIRSACASLTLAERINAITELEAGIAMLQAQANVEAAAFADQRSASDRAAGVGAGSAGRGAPFEIAMAAACRARRSTTSWRLLDS